jgi:transcriptional/translational regulatory protein YebC/TACO1
VQQRVIYRKDTPVCVRVHMENVFTDVLQENTKSLHVDDALADSGLESSHAEVTMEPANRVELNLGDAWQVKPPLDKL